MSLISFSRYLSTLSQSVINRLLHFNGPVPFIEVRNWFKSEFKAVQNKLLWRLKQLQILQGRGQEVWINPSFQKSLVVESFPSVKPPTIPFAANELDSFARSRWEGVLYELVKDSGSEQANAVTKRTRREQTSLEQLLTQAGLLSNGKVTNSGFQFLLKDVSSQVWVLLLHYLDTKNNDPSLLEFLATQILHGEVGSVIYASLGSDYLRQLDEFGLLKQMADGRFTVTQLFTSLAGVKSALDFTEALQSSSNTSGYLVIESNYRVYAYTSSPLQIATLALFVNLQDRFPNMVYGQLTGESVQSALSHGITADQIIQYLNLNAHPCMTRTSGGKTLPFNGIPFTVVDQIRLWELDRKRLAIKPGYLYQQFMTEPEYTAALEEAKAIGAVLYAKPASRVLIISEEGHEHMRNFCRKK